jgi:hypothetical protein
MMLWILLTAVKVITQNHTNQYNLTKLKYKLFGILLFIFYYLYMTDIMEHKYLLHFLYNIPYLPSLEYI